jgi:hypothetical protein
MISVSISQDVSRAFGSVVWASYDASVNISNKFHIVHGGCMTARCLLLSSFPPFPESSIDQTPLSVPKGASIPSESPDRVKAHMFPQNLLVLLQVFLYVN